MYAHVCPHSTHTRIWRTEWPNPQTLNTKPLHRRTSQQSQHHTPSMELHYSNSYQQFSAYIHSTLELTSNWFLVGPQAPQLFIYPFVYQPTSCNTRAHSCTQPIEQYATKQTLGWVGWLAQASEGPTLGSWVTHPLSVLPSVPTPHPWSEHQTPCKPCTK